MSDRGPAAQALIDKAKQLESDNGILTAEVERLTIENERLRQDRIDYSSVTSTDGLNSSEWIWRTGKAEREARGLRERIAALEAELDETNKLNRVLEAGLAAGEATEHFKDGIEAALRWAFIHPMVRLSGYEEPDEHWIQRGLDALLAPQKEPRT